MIIFQNCELKLDSKFDLNSIFTAEHSFINFKLLKKIYIFQKFNLARLINFNTF